VIAGNDPILLTPGPRTTSRFTRQAMLRDWGSWDAAFNRMTQTVRADLVEIVHGENDYVCVPLQGTGTFAAKWDWRAPVYQRIDQAIRSSGPRAAIALASERSGASSVTR
jgi:hypothetical protein